ncbi:MAG: hypothetical protein ACLFR1_09525 [Spirochaetia bacterium]
MKKAIIRIGFFLLGRSLQVIGHKDRYIIEDARFLPKNYIIQLKVVSLDTVLTMRKKDDRFLVIKQVENPDLSIQLRDTQSALLLLFARQTMGQAYAEHRMIVRGIVSHTMSLVRIVERTMQYLFPWFLARTAVKYLRPMGVSGVLRKIRLYVIGLLFGV